MLRGIQHCAVVVSDLDRACWFYGDVLGMAEVPRPSNFTFDGAWFRAGPDEIHLIGASETTCPAGMPDPGAAQRTGLATHLAIEVDSLGTMERRLAGHGVEPVGGPMPRGDGATQLFLRDPDGYLVELFETTGDDQSDAPERAPIRE